jgi:spoIIIJ-associated protein
MTEADDQLPGGAVRAATEDNVDTPTAGGVADGGDGPRAGDGAGPEIDDRAGEEAGDRAGEQAGDRAGEEAGDRAGEEAASNGGATDRDELFRQSEVAADYVEGLLDILDMDGDIDELIANDRPVVEVVGGRLQALVGQRGATLEALQDLTRLAIFRQTGEPSRLLLDIGGYRAARRKELGAVARNAVERVKEYGEPVRLEPMSAFERKCVHDVINATDGVVSESEGVEPDRRIVVRPAA